MYKLNNHITFEHLSLGQNKQCFKLITIMVTLNFESSANKLNWINKAWNQLGHGGIEEVHSQVCIMRFFLYSWNTKLKTMSYYDTKSDIRKACIVSFFSILDYDSLPLELYFLLAFVSEHLYLILTDKWLCFPCAWKFIFIRNLIRLYTWVPLRYASNFQTNTSIQSSKLFWNNFRICNPINCCSSSVKLDSV